MVKLFSDKPCGPHAEIGAAALRRGTAATRRPRAGGGIVEATAPVHAVAGASNPSETIPRRDLVIVITKAVPTPLPDVPNRVVQAIMASLSDPTPFKRILVGDDATRLLGHAEDLRPDFWQG